MKITFIHHSCFCVELAEKVFIFDYFKGDKLSEYSFQGKIPEFSKEQSIYVFSSHQHGDHFDLEVLRWSEKYPNIQYVFSKDIRLSDNYLMRKGFAVDVKKQIHFMKANETLWLDGIKIETLKSTDAGVAFLVAYAGKTIYHAGDLHWWHWDGQDAAVNEYQGKTYRRQVDKLMHKNIDVAFVVMDARLEEARFWGIDYFMKHVAAAVVAPMHLWQQYHFIKEYKELETSREFAERILEVTEENQVFEI